MLFTPFVALALAASATAAKENDRTCNGKVVARLPPKDGPANPKFKDTPPGYFAGQWFQEYSSLNDTSLKLGNFELISTYDPPTDVTTDITSFTVGSCPHIYTTYGTDHVKPGNMDNQPIVLPGLNETVIADVLAYGDDVNCHRYFVVYGRQPGTPSIVIWSQVRGGPAPKTRNAIQTALEGLGNKNITQLAKQIKKLPSDSRTGLADFICDKACQTNKNIPAADGSCPSS